MHGFNFFANWSLISVLYDVIRTAAEHVQYVIKRRQIDEGCPNPTEWLLTKMTRGMRTYLYFWNPPGPRFDLVLQAKLQNYMQTYLPANTTFIFLNKSGCSYDCDITVYSPRLSPNNSRAAFNWNDSSFSLWTGPITHTQSRKTHPTIEDAQSVSSFVFPYKNMHHAMPHHKGTIDRILNITTSTAVILYIGLSPFPVIVEMKV